MSGGLASRVIGLLGGTFDPVHLGHLRAALELYEILGVKEMRLLPCHTPAHRAAPVASPAERLAMLQLALQGQSQLKVDDREVRRGGVSYMVDTLVSLREEVGDTPLCLVLGSDAFAGLPSWQRWQELNHLAHLVVVERPGFQRDYVVAVTDLLRQRRVARSHELLMRPAGSIFCCSVTQLDISSSQIRMLLATAKSPRYLLPGVVLKYIISHGGCYGSAPSGTP